MKKLFSILLVACLLMSVCAGAMAEEFKGLDSSDYSQFPLVKEGEKLTITVAHIRDAAYGVDVEDMWFWTWAEKVTGIDFQVQQILSSSKADLLPLMFAGGDVPDLLLGLNLTTAEISRYGVSEGQLKDLTEWITPERMPYLSAWLEAYPDSKALCTTPDGAIYTLPGYSNIKYNHGVAGRSAQLNYAWMEANNQEAPKTLDELVALLYAFKAANPDATPIAAHAAKEATNGTGGSLMTIFLNAYGFLGDHNEYGHNVSIKDGKAVLAAGHQDFKAYLELMNKFYNDGILMKDYFTADDLAVQTLIQENKSVMAGGVYATIPEVERFQQWKATSPVTSEYCAEPMWVASTPYKVGGALIGAKITDEELDAVLRFLDFFYCEIGGLYLWDGPAAGTEDTLGMVKGWIHDYTKGATGTRVFLDVEEKKYSSGTEYVKGIIGTNASTFGNRSHSLENEKLTYMYELTQYVQDPTLANFVPFTWSEEQGDGWERIYTKANVGPYTRTDAFPAIVYYDEDTQESIDEIRMVMESHIETNVAKFITGARSLAEFDQFVKEIEDLGLRDLEAIYQEAYDAYLAAK
ncbi:MAG: extracellular solute-binding protein [Clostridiales bacterium]|nr:extracellular solute-binding protein [Clostridiales bacterium]